MHDFYPGTRRRFPTASTIIADNDGWVSVGIDHDTAAFAVNAIRRWWSAWDDSAIPTPSACCSPQTMAAANGSRLRLWKLELQKLSCPRFLWTAICQRGDRGDEGYETRNRRH